MSREYEALSRSDMMLLLRLAGLRPDQRTIDDLCAVEAQVRRRVQLVREGLAWADEPATTFAASRSRSET